MILFVIALCLAIGHLFLTKQPKTAKRTVELLLAYIIPLNIGVATLIGFVGHAFYGPEVAKLIGWPAGNPFQFEVAIGNLAMSVAGFLSIWQRKGFWLATTVFSGVYFLGAAYGHFVQMAQGDTSPYNTGLFLYVGDIVIPMVYLILTGIYAYQNKWFGRENEIK